MSKSAFKVMQETSEDCVWACIATILGIEYDKIPTRREVNFLWTNQFGDTSPAITDCDHIFRDLGIKQIDLVPYSSISKYSRKLRIGFAMKNKWEGHAVILKGRKIWHDPYEDGIDWVSEDVLTYAGDLKVDKRTLISRMGAR